MTKKKETRQEYHSRIYEEASALTRILSKHMRDNPESVEYPPEYVTLKKQHDSELDEANQRFQDALDDPRLKDNKFIQAFKKSIRE